MNEDFDFWLSNLSDSSDDEVQASIDMLQLIMNEEAVPHLLKLIMEGSRSQAIRQSAAEAVSVISGEKSRSLIRKQQKELSTSEERRLFNVALSETESD